MAARSLLPRLSLAACTAFSFIVCRMSSDEFRPPSATVSIDFASVMFLSAWPWPRVSACSFLAMAKPAESSSAWLMRRPVERRSRRIDSSLLVFCRLWKACID